MNKKIIRNIVVPACILVLGVAAIFYVKIWEDRKAGNPPQSGGQSNSQNKSQAQPSYNYNSPQTNGAQDSRAPMFYISGGKEGYESGGLIALSNTEEPAITLASYNLNGEASVNVYQADERSLLDFLVHDKEGKQTAATPDVSKFRFVKNFKQNVGNNGQSAPRVLLPIGQSGIWYLDVTINGLKDKAFVVRSKNGGIVKEGDNKFIFWVQDFKTKRSASEGIVRLFNLEDSRKELTSVPLGQDGLATTPFNQDADLAIVESGGDAAVIPINLRWLNASYSYKPFQAAGKATKYFAFTDRPIYKPGDTVYFKSIVRDDYDGSYGLPKGNIQVSVIKDYNEKQPVFQKTYAISQEGSIDGQFALPEDAGSGYYQVKMQLPGSAAYDWANTVYTEFQVDFYRKPEYHLDVAIANQELVAGEKVPVIISGQYFFGQPLSGQKVHYTVYSNTYYDYYLDSSSWALNDNYRYGYWGGSAVMDGDVVLDSKGLASITLDTDSAKNSLESQVFSVEVSTTDETQNPAFTRKNLIVYNSEFGLYRKGWDYYGVRTGGELKLPVVLVPRRGGKAGGLKLVAHVKRSEWIPYKNSGDKYYSYRQETEDFPDLKATTDSSGNATFSFSAKKSGSYVFNVEGKDSKGNTISKEFYGWVSSDSNPYYSGQNNGGLTIKFDKELYQPGQTGKAYISSTIADRDVLLTLQRGHAYGYRVVKLSGRSASTDVLFSEADMPNTIAVASSFSDDAVDRDAAEIKVSADSKKLKVSITPQDTTFGPGETVTLNVQTTDMGGSPVSANTTVWAVDKALFELSESRTGDIFNTFWGQRYDDTQENNSLAGILTQGGAEKGGCFAADTLVTMADGSAKKIQDIKVGDLVLSRSDSGGSLSSGKVTAVEQADDPGYLIINGTLKVTANHLVSVNGSWKEAGSIQFGDKLADAENRPVAVESIEWQGGKFKVYNLSVETSHTFFANGFWVHNQKGDGGGARAIFKDTAYWNPSVHTGNDGRAQVSFKLPDNLTTWVISGVAVTPGVAVGQTKGEITVTKSVVVRPVLPNILRQNDKALLSAIVQNFTDQDHNFNVSLSFDSGEVKAAGSNPVSIKAHDFAQVFWNVSPTAVKDNSKLNFSAKASDDGKLSDSVIQEIPVRPLGFWDNSSESATEPKNFALNLAPDADLSQTAVTLSFAPTLLGSLPSAMGYLVDYPYGCVEQTTSRFVPAVIAKANPDLFAGALQGKNIDEIIKKGISGLKGLQQTQGGWEWWHDGNPDTFITAYVIEYLVQAKQLGFEVPDDMLQRAQSYLEQASYFDASSAQFVLPPVQAPQPPTVAGARPVPSAQTDLVTRVYALTLLRDEKAKKPLVDFTGLTPDLVAMAAIANAKNGFIEARNSALGVLRSMAHQQGQSMYWDAGRGVYFGSKDASTAWALRALLLSGNEEDSNIARQAGRYLLSSRQKEYWSNTFATAQVIRAATDLARQDQELNPNYSYQISLDGKTIKSGTINSFKDSVTIKVPAKDIKASGSSLSITKNGEGQLYPTLQIKQFRTSMDAAYSDHGLKVTRKYINQKGEGAAIAIGDLVRVELTVEGFGGENNYGVVEDQLPSGLIPVNRQLNNEQATQGAYGYQSYPYYDYSYGTDVTENGAIISLYNWYNQPNRTYVYQARAVSEGEFVAPPATASLMYQPEVYGRSKPDTITIVKYSEAPVQAINRFLSKALGVDTGKPWFRIGFFTLVGLVVLAAIVLALRTFRRARQSKKTPPEIKPPGQDSPHDENPPQ